MWRKGDIIKSVFYFFKELLRSYKIWRKNPNGRRNRRNKFLQNRFQQKTITALKMHTNLRGNSWISTNIGRVPEELWNPGEKSTILTTGDSRSPASIEPLMVTLSCVTDSREETVRPQTEIKTRTCKTWSKILVKWTSARVLTTIITILVLKMFQSTTIRGKVVCHPVYSPNKRDRSGTVRYVRDLYPKLLIRPLHNMETIMEMVSCSFWNPFVSLWKFFDEITCLWERKEN